ncbi:MAG: hypothetical protein QG652_1812 [Pseudomonadota bacterium]|nr:hypothetical protein [Pseudomonadota bacterium]
MDSLQSVVQTNCHISDAQYAGNYTLCIYLLKMREFYRWETQQTFGQPLSNDDIGQWLTGREQLWQQLENRNYAALHINGMMIDVFESRIVNDFINPQKLVYSGGFGQYGKPVFFLAELQQKHTQDDYTIYVSGRELARDLAAPPGMTQDKCVYIRRESLRRFIWEKFEESHWHKNENPLARALAGYNFSMQPEAALEDMTDHEIHTVLLHEIGEIRAGQLLGEEWEQMLASLPRSQAELMARAVRDHIADALSTLPELINSAAAAQIHFYFANLGSLRKLIFPSLMNAYKDWNNSHDVSAIRRLICVSQTHWLNMAKSLLQLHKKYGNQSHVYMEALIRNNYL